MHVLLSGIVGSHAYGLAHAGSDVDRLGIFAHDTTDLLRLSPPPDTVDSRNPDKALHDARKAVHLLLACNPTVTEVLWLEDYETLTPFGAELVSLRQRLLCAHRVRRAYLGYADSQLKRLMNRQDSELDEQSHRKRAKHARHLVRLAEQGARLYLTGRLTLRLENPGQVVALGEEIARHPEMGAEVIAEAEARMASASALPEEPDVAVAEDWLLRVRGHYYTPPA